MPNLKTVIANLTDLTDLSLSHVWINTDLPPMIANLSKLTSLELAWCDLQGQFPTKVLSLPELRVLNLRYNRMLHADFSTSDVQWRSPLQVVDLFYCNFTGQLPDSIGNSSDISLISFKIGGCGFHGDIPSWTWNVTEEISLQGNSLSGSLPAAVNGEILARLSTIDLSGNRIGGTIPAWLFTLPSLNYLRLEDNLFTGIDQFTIPNGSANSVLLEFSAHNNQLHGQIPEALFELRSLQYLLLQNNNLTGTIPVSMLLGIRNLSSLSLSDNNLSIIDDMGFESISSIPRFLLLGLSSCNLGDFPIFLRDQKNLTKLELSNNGIHGSVPEWFLDMNLLQFLDLSHNSLTGGLEYLPRQNIYNIHIASNMLEGAVPIPPAPISFFRATNNRFSGEIPSSLCHLPHLVLSNRGRFD